MKERRTAWCNAISAAVLGKARALFRGVFTSPLDNQEGVTQRIEQISAGVFKVNPGSLMLAFQRMDRDGLIEAEWRASENGRRAKYYRLTSKGRKRLKLDTGDWARRVAAIAKLLEA